MPDYLRYRPVIHYNIDKNNRIVSKSVVLVKTTLLEKFLRLCFLFSKQYENKEEL